MSQTWLTEEPSTMLFSLTANANNTQEYRNEQILVSKKVTSVRVHTWALSPKAKKPSYDVYFHSRFPHEIQRKFCKQQQPSSPEEVLLSTRP